MSISILKGSSQWVELATASSTSGSTVSFTSLPRYSNYLVQGFNIDCTTEGPSMRFNNDTGSNYGWIRNDSDTGPTANKIATVIAIDNGVFQALIMGADQVVKEIEIWSGSLSGATKFADTIKALWNDSSVINRIDFVTPGTYSTGTFKVYGRN